jgi:PPOX class probable F420-dependent enzyme
MGGLAAGHGEAEKLVSELSGGPVPVSAHQVDLTDPAATDDFVTAVAEQSGGVHTVIHAAGPFVPQTYLSQVTPAMMLAQLTKDPAAFFALVHAALPALRTSRGSVVAVTTAATRRHPARDGLSTGPKGAVEALARAFAAERNVLTFEVMGATTLPSTSMRTLRSSADTTPRRATVLLHRRQPGRDPAPSKGYKVGTNERARIVMSDAEVADFIARSRTATVASIGQDGMPHLVAMWYGVIDDAVYIETKAKSQKAMNLRRDPRMVFMVEAGTSYNNLRGVSIEGRGEIIEEPDVGEYWAAARSVYERYTGPYTDDALPVLQYMMRKRIVVRLLPERIRSWDHRKLGLDPAGAAGSTAASIGSE